MSIIFIYCNSWISYMGALCDNSVKGVRGSRYKEFSASGYSPIDVDILLENMKVHPLPPLFEVVRADFSSLMLFGFPSNVRQLLKDFPEPNAQGGPELTRANQFKSLPNPY
ncbi:hypothetical protein SASPL_114303 [Salvia splendens]|uniref:Uncharacterized protein n=1 Tax=Salvia splendens TaxID=180675 RepID=A0A8X9A124_SALSN|nr:hypothetical protein SASPL_114303 [Salvia splendens]